MPYINRKQRGLLNGYIKNIENVIRKYKIPLKPALSYTITRLAKNLAVPKSYDIMSDIIGMLICTTLEYYRREVSPYEDKKIKENDDV